MGEGMKRMARAYGGMRVSARGTTCDYVAKGEDFNTVIGEREREGWTYIGPTGDDEFLRFTMPTEQVDKQEGKR